VLRRRLRVTLRVTRWWIEQNWPPPPGVEVSSCDECTCCAATVVGEGGGVNGIAPVVSLLGESCTKGLASCVKCSYTRERHSQLPTPTAPPAATATAAPAMASPATATAAPATAAPAATATAEAHTESLLASIRSA
jgi:hypothetical protein